MVGERAQAFVMQGYSVLFNHRSQIAEMALRNRLPAASVQRELAEAGFLLTYGADIRHPHCVARAQQLGEAYRIAPVRLHSVAALLRNERGSHHQTLVAEAFEQSVEPISCRPCFIAKRQKTVSGATIKMRIRIASSVDVPRRGCHCLTRMFPVVSSECSQISSSSIHWERQSLR